MTTVPFVLAPVTVTDVCRLSPSYVRIEFGGEPLADIGVDGPWFDQRIKVIFPPPSGVLPDLDGTDADWYAAWLAIPECERGAMRTYSVREVRGSGANTRLVVEFVLHLQPGATGPASTWAARAAIGDRVLVLAPRRGHRFGGIEFAPGDATRLLLVADETAVPALSRILADLPEDAHGSAFCEVPDREDIRVLEAPVGIEVRWLSRGGSTEVGRELLPSVLDHLGADPVAPPGGPLPDEQPAETVWETSSSSAAGHELASDGGLPGLYAWVAGESHMVTTLRRHLVHGVGVDRRQVAFMGYWRHGVAMRG